MWNSFGHVFTISSLVLEGKDTNEHVRMQWRSAFAARGQIDPPPLWAWRSHAIWKWLRDAWLYVYWGLKWSFVLQLLARCFLKQRQTMREKVPDLLKVKDKLKYVFSWHQNSKINARYSQITHDSMEERAEWKYKNKLPWCQKMTVFRLLVAAF